MSDTVKNIGIGVVATIFVILAIVGFSTLVGGDEHEGHEHSAERTTSAPAPQVEASSDDVFLHLVHDNLPETRNVPDSELIEAGHMTCDTIGEVGLEFFLTYMENEGNASEHFTSVMVAASLVAYCPELTPPDWDEEEVGV